jgi:hypothetical protein
MPVARPDKTRKNQVLVLSAKGLLHLPALYTNPERMTIITKVRISVARSESTPSKPILANIAVSAAKTAERRAQ